MLIHIYGCYNKSIWPILILSTCLERELKCLHMHTIYHIHNCDLYFLNARLIVLVCNAVGLIYVRYLIPVKKSLLPWKCCPSKMIWKFVSHLISYWYILHDYWFSLQLMSKSIKVSMSTDRLQENTLAMDLYIYKTNTKIISLRSV